MATRKVNLALIAYFGVGADDKPVSSFGQLGEEVEVHESDLARFDELNDQHGTEPEAHVFVPQPDPLDHGAGGPVGDFERPERDADVDADINGGEDGQLEEPSKRDSLGDWQAYAEQEGVATEHEDGTPKTKKELVSELTED